MLPDSFRGRWRLLALLPLALGGCARSDSLDPPAPVPALTAPAEAAAVSHFEDARVTEASGIQRSLRMPDLFWVHNDSGHDASLYATDAAGRALGRVVLAGVEAVDWEDISAYEQDGEAQLVVGDIGDNAGSRDYLLLYVFPEPAIERWPAGAEPRIDTWRRIELRYADGAGHDSESMAVDAAGDAILVVTKDPLRPEQQALWSAPLRAALREGAAELRFEAAVDLGYAPPGPGSLNPGSFATTGLDLHPDGQELALLTYGELATGEGRVYRWRRQSGESWAMVLQRPASATQTVPAAGNVQAEGLGYSGDGRWLLVVAENPPGPTSTLSVLKLQ